MTDTLETAIAAALNAGQPEVEPEETTEEETQEEETTEEETTEESEEEDREEPEELTDEEAAAKLDELEEKYGKPEEEDPWAPVNAEEQFLLNEQAELQKGFLSGLPSIKNDAGISIYEMQEPQFDQFLQQLDDDGKERLKVTAIQAREKAIQQAEIYQNRYANFNSRVQTFNQMKMEMEVITDIAKQLGIRDVVKQYRDGNITRHLQEKAKTDASIAQKAGNKDGLYQLAIMAIRDLGIVKSKDEKSKKPSAPDAKADSKKVKTKIQDNSDEALLAKVSKNPSEYRKLDQKTRDRLMYASIREVI